MRRHVVVGVVVALAIGYAAAPRPDATPASSLASLAPPAGATRESTTERTRVQRGPVAIAGGYATPPFVASSEPQPITIAFHSLCFDPRWTCDWFRADDLAPQWQLCPRAPTACGGGGTRWDGDARAIAPLVEASVAALRAQNGTRDGTVLLGYSNGAYAVTTLVHDLARARIADVADVAGVVLFGSDARIAASDARALGMRVGLTAGDLDGAAAAMRAHAAELRAAGVDARFVSLGRVGHVLPQSTSAAIGELVDWARDGR